MKNIYTNREILLQTNSNFFKRECCELNNKQNDKQLSQKEQLIQLCWNGMLTEIIPEICGPGATQKALTLWEINESGHLLDLRFGDVDEQMNDGWSINPYVFLSLTISN